MRVSMAILATLCGLSFSACTSSKPQKVVVPDSSLSPKPGTQSRQGAQTSPGQGNDVTAPGGNTTIGAETVPTDQGSISNNPNSVPETIITGPDGGGNNGVTPPPSGGTAGNGSGNNPVQPSAQAGNGKTRLNELTVSTPAGFAVTQQAQAEGVTLVGFAKGDDFAAMYSKSGSGMTTQGIFVNGSKVVTPESTKKVGNYDWKMIETTMTVARGLPHAGTYYVTGFLMEKGGVTYYGYGKSGSADAARSAAQAVLNSVQ